MIISFFSFFCSLSIVAPSWVLEPQDITVIRGHSALINCLAKGNPKPIIEWKKKVGKCNHNF